MKLKPGSYEMSVYKKLAYAIACLVFLSTACNLPLMTAPSATKPADPESLQVASLGSLEAQSKTRLEMHFDHGFPRAVSLDVPVAGANSVERARSFLATYRDLYLQSNPDLQLNVLRTSGENDRNVVFTQTYKGLPVYAGEISVLFNGDRVRATSGALLNSYASLDILPGISALEAEALARAALEMPGAVVAGKTGLMVFDQSLFDNVPSAPHLAWKVTLGGGIPWRAFMDAKTGQLLFKMELTESGDYDFEEWDAAGDNAYDSNCYWGAGPHSIGDEDALDDDYQGDMDATSAYAYAHDAYYFYKNSFGLNTDDFGGQIEVGIHANVDNALWRGSCDIAEFRDGWVGWDVMVHEFGHGVIAHKSNLDGYGQTGALNESFADVMGVYADPGDWQLGEDRTNGQGAIRDLRNPARDFITDYNYDGDDKGGVHANSTIFSKAAYLLGCDDGSDDLCGFHNGWEVSPIGLNKVAYLFFDTLVLNVPSDAQFFDAANVATVLAYGYAENGTAGFTKDDACQVRNAFAAVGLIQGDFGCDGTVDGAKDSDNDYIPDDEDNCINDKNPIQADYDHDGYGNACDTDADGDGIKNKTDNCEFGPNADQKDGDHDGIGDVCDDSDGDGLFDIVDNCDNVKNPTQADMDNDKRGDACDLDIDGDYVSNDSDNCVLDPNTTQNDTDHDGEGDACDVDTDSDGLSNDNDNCPFTPNPNQENSDGDGAGDACDPTPICNDVSAWSAGVQIGEDFIPPQPLANPLACTPDALTPSTMLNPGTDSDGGMHQVDIAGEPGRHVILPLPDCKPDQDGWYSRDWRALLTIDGLGKNIGFMVVDGSGNRRAKGTRTEVAGQDHIQVLFTPGRSRDTYLDLLFAGDFPSGEKANFGVQVVCGLKADVSNRLAIPTALPLAPAMTATPAATATPAFTPTVELPCTWTAAVNMFVRQGPGSSHYDDIGSLNAGQSAPVVGQSQDDYWWALQTPGGIGYVPKEPRFGSLGGACEGLPVLQAPPTITPTITPVNLEIPVDPGVLLPTATILPQCSDRIDNDGDGRIDMDDSQCRSTTDNDESTR